MIGKFYERGIIDSSMGETYVCLIPKKENATKVNDLGPLVLSRACIRLLLRCRLRD